MVMDYEKAVEVYIKRSERIAINLSDDAPADMIYL
jgi:hypothetical protein